MHRLRFWILARIRGVKRIDVRGQHQPARFDKDRNLRGEEVVVAESDLVGRGRVVFVDHRHDVPFEQLLQRLTRVHVAGTRADVVRGQEDLRGLDAVCGEKVVVVVVDLTLPDGGRSLELGHRAGARRQAQQLNPA